MEIVLHEAASDISEQEWGALDHSNDPFVSHTFLGTAEKVGAAGVEMGWQARHLAVYEEGNLLGLLPLYLRTHSFGDFSRDWDWPSAWQRRHLAYYPKLVSGVPYTPSPGPRLLVRQDVARDTVTSALIDGAIRLAHESGASSWQCLFVEAGDRTRLSEAGLLMRRGVQFHWFNRSYRDFDDFLSRFTAEKRKKVRRERRAVQEAGVRLDVLHGDEIDEPLWNTIHRHYRRTFARYGNYPAFPLEFFIEAGSRLARRLIVFIAYRDEKAVASAICYRNADTLFGRHWGAEIELPGLHFEVCYYSGIEYCIRHGLMNFEPGAQGEHKLARGFEPVPTWSAFWIADPGMLSSVRDFAVREESAMQKYETETACHLPFKLDQSPRAG